MLLVVFTAMLLASTCQAAPLVLTANMQHASLEGRLEHFADPSNALSFKVARQQHFTLLPAFRSQGYDDAAHWYRFELDRADNAPANWILTVGTVMLDEVDVWVEGPDGGFRHHALGDHRPYEARPLKTRQVAIPIEVSARTSVYLRVRSTSSINVSAELWQPGAFAAEETKTNFGQGVYFGILLIVAVFYGILGTWSRNAILAAYAGYVASLIPLHMGFKGYLPMVLPSGIPWLNDAVWCVSFLLGTTFMVLMWTRLLDMQRNFPRLHLVYKAIGLVNVALIPFVQTPVFLALAPLLNIAAIWLAFATPTMLAILWWRRRGIELAVYFVAFIGPAAGSVLQVLLAMGSVTNNAFTANAYQMASLLHVVVMSFGLALRLRQMQQDKAAAEQGVALATQRADEQRRFVAMLSHEFRNPLAAIDRSAQMIELKSPELASQEIPRLERIRSNTAALASLVDNFLLTEALDHGGMTLSHKPYRIRSLLESSVQMLRENIGESISLTVTPPDAVFDLDPTLMGMAIGNLAGNALRYSSPDSPVEISATVDAQGLRVLVADRGPGMSDDELAMLGTPYYRAASSQGKQGSGLGYHFTRRIVEAHGGQLSASHRPGGGLNVEIHLP